MRTPRPVRAVSALSRSGVGMTAKRFCACACACAAASVRVVAVVFIALEAGAALKGGVDSLTRLLREHRADEGQFAAPYEKHGRAPGEDDEGQREQLAAVTHFGERDAELRQVAEDRAADDAE